MAKLDSTKYNAQVANAAAQVKISSTVFKAFIADVKTVVDGNDDEFIELENLLFSTASKTYYIDAASGSDSNNGTTSGTAWATWTKAKSMIPKFILSGHAYVIKIIGDLVGRHVLEGVNVSDSSGLIIEGSTTTVADQEISKFSIVACHGGSSSAIILRYLTTVYDSGVNDEGFLVAGSSGVRIISCNPQATMTRGVSVFHSFAQVLTCNFGTDKVEDCISASTAIVYSSGNSGNGTAYGLSASAGATIGKNSTQPTGTTGNESTSTGGTIA